MQPLLAMPLFVFIYKCISILILVVLLDVLYIFVVSILTQVPFPPPPPLMEGMELNAFGLLSCILGAFATLLGCRCICVKDIHKDKIKA